MLYLKYILVTILVMSAFNYKAQSNLKNDLIIEPYVGFPNWSSKSIVQRPDLGITFNNLNYNDYGPIGIKSEYFLTPKKSLGIDIFLKGYKLNGDFLSDSTLNKSTNTYDYQYSQFKYSVNRVRVQLRYNLHFENKNPKFDTYFGFGFGYNGNFSFLTVKTDKDENSIEDKIKKSSQSTVLKTFNSAVIPLSMRICYGIRYNFNEDFGLNTEFGIGGSTLLFGLSFRY